MSDEARTREGLLSPGHQAKRPSARSGTDGTLPPFEGVDLHPQAKEKGEREGSAFDRFCSSFNDLRDRIFRQELWNKEATLIVLSSIVLAVIAIVLSENNGKPLSYWRASNSITLNAFISVLTTLLWVFLTPVQSKCISQLRWLHYRASSGKPLSDFQTFNDAKGGPAAFGLLLTPGKSWLTRFAAVVTILQITINPFTQQILQTGTRDLATSEPAKLPVARQVRDPKGSSGEGIGLDVNSTAGVFGNAINNLTSSFASSFLNGVFDSSVSDFPVTTECASGNCTWNDEYATLIMKPTITNMTDQLRHASTDQVAAWLSNYTLVQEQANASYANVTPSWSVVSMPYTGTANPGITASWLINEVVNTIAQVPVAPPPRMPNGSTDFTAASMNVSLFRVQAVNSFVNLWNTTTNLYEGKVWLTVDMYYQEMIINGTLRVGGVKDASVAYGNSSAWRAEHQFALQPARSQQELGQLSEQYTAGAIFYNGTECYANRNQSGTPATCSFTIGSYHGQDFLVDADFAGDLANGAGAALNGDNIDAILAWLNPTTGEIALESTRYSNYTSVTAFYLNEIASRELYGPSNPSSTNDTNNTSTRRFLAHRSENQQQSATMGITNSTLTVEQAMANMARSITSWLRSLDGSTVSGTLLRTQTTYAVVWGWIVIPAALILFTVALLVATALQSRRHRVPAWADSMIAVLAHGIEDEAVRAQMTQINGFEELRRAAREVDVCLRKGDNVLEVVEGGR